MSLFCGISWKTPHTLIRTYSLFLSNPDFPLPFYERETENRVWGNLHYLKVILKEGIFYCKLS